MTSICTEVLAPGITAFSRLANAGKLCELAPFDDNLTTLCQAGGDVVASTLLAPVDKKILCSIFCCCNINPNYGNQGQSLRQSCVRDVVRAVDNNLEGKSRYKAEVSYDMNQSPPVPSHFGGLGTRRPDVVIVANPSLPPERSNIVKVVEMKFPGDRYREGQLQDYDAIDPTGNTMELNADKCGCSDDKNTRSQMELVKGAERVQAAQRSTWRRVGWGALATVGAVATALLVLSPFDGPAGELAAGAATARSAGLAFTRAGLSEAGIAASRRAAVETWKHVFTRPIPTW